MNIRYKEQWNNILKEKRKISGLTQDAIASICNTYKSRWSLYESGNAYPTDIEWQLIYHHLNSTPFDFLLFEDIKDDEYKLLELTHNLIHKFRSNKSQTLLNKYIKFSIIEMEHLFEKNKPEDDDWIA